MAIFQFSKIELILEKKVDFRNGGILELLASSISYCFYVTGVFIFHSPAFQKAKLFESKTPFWEKQGDFRKVFSSKNPGLTAPIFSLTFLIDFLSQCYFLVYAIDQHRIFTFERECVELQNFRKSIFADIAFKKQFLDNEMEDHKPLKRFWKVLCPFIHPNKFGC